MTVRLLATSVAASILLCCAAAVSASTAPARGAAPSDTATAGPSGSDSAGSSAPSYASPLLKVPPSAGPGSQVFLDGAGFSPGKPVKIWIAPAATTSEPTPLEVNANPDGTLTQQVIAPTDPGDYAVLACQSCNSGFETALRRCAAQDLTGLACASLTVVGSSPGTGLSTANSGSATSGPSPSSSASAVSGGLPRSTSSPWAALLVAGIALLLAAALITALLRRRVSPHGEAEARLRRMAPGGISVHDGAVRLELRVTTSVPPPVTTTEDTPP